LDKLLVDDVVSQLKEGKPALVSSCRVDRNFKTNETQTSYDVYEEEDDDR